MNIDDTVRLCKLVKALAPAQKIDDETPAIWQGVMANIELADAMEAVKHIAQTQAFVAPCDIIQRVKAARAARVDGVDTDLPAVDPDNVPEYLAAIREMRARRAGKPGREERPVRREVGHFERHAIEAGPDAVTPASQAHIAALRRSVSRAFPLQVPKVDAVREGQERPSRQVSATRAITDAEARRIDAARVRQAAGLDAITERDEAR